MTPDFNKYQDGLVPVIVQDTMTRTVLMLGFMNEEAFERTKQEKKVCFYSRTKKTLWTKGETSGNYLMVDEILPDCDNDTLLIKARPTGPVCHTGADTCFGENNSAFSLAKLEKIILQRKLQPATISYTSSLFSKGVSKVAQKVGEEAIELVIESMRDEKEKFLNEAADLVYHFLVLLRAKDQQLSDVVEVLASRHKPA